MIDCHCHLLPGVDDGAKSLEYALSMARKAVETGISDSIVTPHHLNGVFLNPLNSVLQYVSEFQNQLKTHDIDLKIHPGSELHLVPELISALDQKSAMTYANQEKAVLVELPKHSVPVGSVQILENIVYRGLTPVIAHPERNSFLRRNLKVVGEWLEIGCRFQLTAQSCAGDFGDSVKNACHYWCDKGWIHFIASDAHRIEGRAPDMRSGVEKIEKWLGADAANLLSTVNPKRLITGEHIPLN